MILFLYSGQKYMEAICDHITRECQMNERRGLLDLLKAVAGLSQRSLGLRCNTSEGHTATFAPLLSHKNQSHGHIKASDPHKDIPQKSHDRYMYSICTETQPWHIDSLQKHTPTYL